MKQFRAYIILFGIMEESQETDDADGSCHNFDSSGHGLKLAFHAFITILREREREGGREGGREVWLCFLKYICADALL